MDKTVVTIPRETNLSFRVTAAIESLLMENHIEPGDYLPSERKLGEQFGVSRTVVREAVRSLVAKGLLEVHPGSGTVVCRPTASSVSDSINRFWGVGQPNRDYEKVREIRRTLEIEVAGLAAERRSQADLDELEEIINRMSADQENKERLATDDVAFHAGLARATHNDLFVLLLDSISDLMMTVRRTGIAVPGASARALAYHRAILAQVADANPAGARAAMFDHLIEAEETQRQAWALAHHGAGQSSAAGRR